MKKLPVVFISHGGGPWPWMPEMREMYRTTVEALSAFGQAHSPRAILIVTAHWEEKEFTLSTSALPEMIYDYGGFPPHTYTIQYKAPGDPELAKRIKELLESKKLHVNTDSERGYDHGTFVPLYCMYPEASVPVVQLSIKSSYDVEEHYRLGEALSSLRDEGVLIVGSGLTYHNLRKFFNQTGAEPSRAFEGWLTEAMASPMEERLSKLKHWEKAPFARDAHPREDHLVPLFVIAGAAGEDPGQRFFVDRVFGIEMASYQFG